MSGRFNALINNNSAPGNGSKRTRKRRERRRAAKAAAKNGNNRNNSRGNNSRRNNSKRNNSKRNNNRRNNSKRNNKTKKPKSKGKKISLTRGLKAAALAATLGLGGTTNVGAVRDYNSNYGSADGSSYLERYPPVCAVPCRGGNNMDSDNCNTCLVNNLGSGRICEFGTWGDGSCRNPQNFGGRTRKRRRKKRTKKRKSIKRRRKRRR